MSRMIITITIRLQTLDDYTVCSIAYGRKSKMGGEVLDSGEPIGQ